MPIIEYLSAVGLPARVLGRLPLLVRYAYVPGRTLNGYGEERYHKYHLRIWLWLDVLELEVIEKVISSTDAAEVDAFRKSRLDTASTTGAVGGLLASASSAILAITSLADVHYVPRGLFMLSLLLALLSVYFTLLQQRELLVMTPDTFREWLSEGIDTTPKKGSRPIELVRDQTAQSGIETTRNENPATTSTRKTPRSSLAANVVLQAPFELLAISITLFLAALGSYLGLLYASKVKVSEGWDSNLAVLAAFVATAVFSLVVYGQALGQKDREMAATWAKHTQEGLARRQEHRQPVGAV